MWAVPIALFAVQAVSSYSAGQQEKQLRNREAALATRQGRVEALRFHQRGNELLKLSMETQALARARAAAGGVDPFSGSAQFVEELSAKEGIEDVKQLQENAVLARQGAQVQSDILMDAGRYARSRGLLAGVTAIGQGAYSFERLGGQRAPARRRPVSNYNADAGITGIGNFA